MTQEQAIADLKKAKELLDLEIITQEEYDKIKADLLPSLRVGFDHPQHNVEEKTIQNSASVAQVAETAPSYGLKAEEISATKDTKSEPTQKLDNVSRSDNAYAALLVVVALIMVGLITTFIITFKSKKEATTQNKTTTTAAVTTTITAPIDVPATETEIAEAWSQWLKLYDELEKFKKKSDFHIYGLSSASPYHNWAKRVDDLGQTKGGNELLGRYEVNSFDLTQLAWQYISSKGKDNDYTSYIAGIVKKKRNKVVVEQEPVIEDVSGFQSSSKEEVIGQWRVSNRYVKDEFDVIIKKEGTKYYAYKAGNKKQVRKEGNKYYEIGNEWGEYYYVTNDGNMNFGDEDGLVSPDVGYIIVKK